MSSRWCHLCEFSINAVCMLHFTECAFCRMLFTQVLHSARFNPQPSRKCSIYVNKRSQDCVARCTEHPGFCCGGWSYLDGSSAKERSADTEYLDVPHRASVVFLSDMAALVVIVCGRLERATYNYDSTAVSPFSFDGPPRLLSGEVVIVSTPALSSPQGGQDQRYSAGGLKLGPR